MGKMHFMPFYIHAWLYDTRVCTDAESKVLIDLICFMWNAPKRGILIGHPQDLARMVGKEWSEFNVILDGLKRKNILEVTDGNGEVTIMSRRMVREENARESGRLRKRIHDRRKGNAKVTGKKLEDISNPIVPFEHFYSLYPKKQARADAEKAWLSLNATLELWEKEIRPALVAQAANPKWAEAGGRFIPMPGSWIRGRRWEDQLLPFETKVTSGEPWLQTQI